MIMQLQSMREFSFSPDSYREKQATCEGKANVREKKINSNVRDDIC